MEPLNDSELHELLAEWSALPAPESLEDRIFRKRTALRRSVWLLTGNISVPVPVFLLLIVALCFLGLGVMNRNVPQKAGRQASFSDFRPVKQLQPKIIRSSYEEN